MTIITEAISSMRGVRLAIHDESGIEQGHAYLYIMYNDLHSEPFGLMEDVFMEESSRGKGYGTQLLERLVQEAKDQGCYKLIGTSRDSRPKVHALYEKLGFVSHGREFRMNLK